MTDRYFPTLQHPAGRLRPLVLALACAGCAAAYSQALPTWNNSVVRQGNVSIGQPTPLGTGKALAINQGSDRAIVDWQGFSIGAANQVRISQPGAASVLLNRVTGNEASTIAGSLVANGHVFLVNPNGVLFSPGATVNVGGLVASTLQLSNSDADFMQGATALTFRDGGNALGVTNAGTLTSANAGGTVALIGSTVRNDGRINAPGGSIGLLSAGTVTVDLAGDGLTRFRVDADALQRSGVINTGTLQADGGRVALLASTAALAEGVVNNGGIVRARSLEARNGEIVLDAGNSSAGVRVRGGMLDAQGTGPGSAGGAVTLTGRSIGVESATLDASGIAGGGTVRLSAEAEAGKVASGHVAMTGDSVIRADALQTGNGGDIRLMGERALRAYGTLSARGGSENGNGGFIEASGGYRIPKDGLGGGIDVAGLRTNAAAPTGQAGTWLIDPYNVTIVPGSAPITPAPPPVAQTPSPSPTPIPSPTPSPSPTAPAPSPTAPAGKNSAPLATPDAYAPFIANADSTIYDADLNNALNSGTSVRITTGIGGSAFQGDILMTQGVHINYNTARGTQTFQLDAHRSVRSDTGVVIESSGAGGPLNVLFNADANGGGAATGGGQVSFSGSIYTNGGTVAMKGAWANASNTTCSICVDGPAIDTRAGRSDAGAGGAVQLVGNTRGVASTDLTTAGVLLRGTQIQSASGNVTISGSNSTATGTQIDGVGGAGGISATTGNISVIGVGNYSANSATAPGAGVAITGATVRSVDGIVAIHGLRQAGGTQQGDGVALRTGSLLTTSGSGLIEVTGRSDGGGAGVSINGGRIAGGGNVLVRASNNGQVDAIAIGSAVSAGNVLDLRAGTVDSQGSATDRPADTITLGGTAATGFALSGAETTRLAAPTTVFGSTAQSGDIRVIGALSMPAALTLQTSGAIAVDAPLTATRLGLAAGADIRQSSGATVTADVLLARSTGASVLLGDPGNRTGTVGGDAANRFEYANATALTLGPVTATGFDAASNLPRLLQASTTAGDAVLVRTQAGDLRLAAAVRGTTSTDLVTAGRLQNSGDQPISGGPWRIWADTWEGETRGSLAGSGATPNLYGCAYGSNCTVTVTPADRHFIYRQQPTATVTVGSGARAEGEANPVFGYQVAGLILGDATAGITGTPSTQATQASAPGAYPVAGTFSSAQGYLLNVVPGSLTVVPRGTTPPPVVDPGTGTGGGAGPGAPGTENGGGSTTIPVPGAGDTSASRLLALSGSGWFAADNQREQSTMFTYDRNIGPVPICFATGPLEGDPIQQQGDTLAREWSRVRSRPNLTNCLADERRNGCGDF